MLKQDNAKLRQTVHELTQKVNHLTQKFEQQPEQPQPKVMKLLDKLEEEQTNTHPSKQ